MKTIVFRWLASKALRFAAPHAYLQSQRDCVLQPRVASLRATLGLRWCAPSTLKGLWPARNPFALRPHNARAACSSLSAILHSPCSILVLTLLLALLPRPAAADWALYAASYGNNKIIKYDTNGVGTVFATNGVNGVLNQPNGLLFDNVGNLFVANNGNNTIEKYDSEGNGTLFANSGGNNPNGLAFDGLNHLFVANYSANNLYQITNALGQGSVFASGASLDEPQGIAFDNAGNLWVANPYGGWIERLDPQGSGTKVYSSNLGGVSSLAFDAAGNLYASGGSVVLKFDPSGNRTTFATGFSSSTGLAFDSAGDLYVADGSTYLIKKVTPQGTVTTFAGGLTSGLKSPTFLAIRETRYQGSWYKAAAGGGTATNAEFTLNGTTGQQDAGTPLTGGQYGMVGGFWARISVVPTPGAPTLNITITSTNTAMVSWLSPSTGWNLQQNTDLTTSNWGAPAQSVTDNGIIKYIIVNPPVGNQFYRLQP